MQQGKKSARGASFDLDALAYVGVAEFARQWLLLTPRPKHKPEKGDHKLALSVGGNAGHSAAFDLDIYEGPLNKNGADRTWDVHFESESGQETQSETESSDSDLSIPEGYDPWTNDY